MRNIVIGLFENRSRAQTAAQELARAGFDQSDIHLVGSESEFKNAIASTDMSTDETHYYTDEIKRGAAAVALDVGHDRAERALFVLRSQKARATGETHLEGEVEMAIPVIEEELHIGKRRVEHGGVRIYKRVTERPIEQQINLREEKVNVERHAVNRVASERDMNVFQKGEIEFTEMGEEPVIAKEAHVVEEVIVRKEVVDHPETIRDTVRRTDIEVERLARTEGKRSTATGGRI